MNISYYTIKAGLNPAVGYGYAGKNIVKSLNNLGYQVGFANPKADVQLNFTQPHHFKFHKGQYQIGYMPWESTSMRPDWIETFDRCDEVWTTSNWCAKIFKQNGIKKDVYVYPHGIESFWKPKRRELKEGQPFKFLHIGEPSPRKDGQIVAETFGKLFGNNPDYQLTIKAHNFSTIRMYNNRRELVSPDQVYNNIKIITEEYPESMLVALYHSHHCLVYPSWGEGFGFIPLQGLATGMPVISTYDWAHYDKYLGPLKLKSQLSDDTLPKSVGDPYIGKMYKPDRMHLEDQMFEVVNNYRAYAGYYYAQSTRIHKEYNWDRLTNKMFKDLEKRFSKAFPR